jgi:hypothetical protein
VRAERTLFVGMNHQFDHNKYNDILRDYREKEGLVIELAFDGMVTSFPFQTSSVSPSAASVSIPAPSL